VRRTKEVNEIICSCMGCMDGGSCGGPNQEKGKIEDRREGENEERAKERHGP